MAPMNATSPAMAKAMGRMYPATRLLVTRRWIWVIKPNHPPRTRGIRSLSSKTIGLSELEIVEMLIYPRALAISQVWAFGPMRFIVPLFQKEGRCI